MVKNQSPAALPSDSYDFVRFCMADMLMKFEVRTQKAYTVAGGSTLFLHSVYADDTDHGRCKDAETPLLTGRAYEDEMFHNPVANLRDSFL